MFEASRRESVAKRFTIPGPKPQSEKDTGSKGVTRAETLDYNSPSSHLWRGFRRSPIHSIFTGASCPFSTIALTTDPANYDRSSRASPREPSQSAPQTGENSFSVGEECTEPEQSSMTNIRRFRTFRDQP